MSFNQLSNLNLIWEQIPKTYQYPVGIAQRIEKTEFDESKISQIKQNLSNQTIINIYGLSGSGKGTLSRALAEKLEISCLDSGQIFRALTFAFITTGLENNVVNVANLLNEINIELANSKLSFQFRGKLLGLEELRSSEVNKKIADFASKDYVQLAYFDKIYDIISDYGKPVVLDGRGGKPPHILKAEHHGYQLFKILLEVDNKVNFERQRIEILNKLKTENPNFVVNDEVEKKILNDFIHGYLERNRKDIDWMTKMDIGVVVKGAIIDTSQMSPKEVLETSLAYIYSELGLDKA
jgi:cytidylate kinase